MLKRVLNVRLFAMAFTMLAFFSANQASSQIISMCGGSMDLPFEGLDTRPVCFSATGLTANVVVTAPTDYAVATSIAGPFSSTVNVTPSGGAISKTTIWVRYTGAASQGPADFVSFSSTGAETKFMGLNQPDKPSNYKAPSYVRVEGAFLHFYQTDGFSAKNFRITVVNPEIGGTIEVEAPAGGTVRVGDSGGFSTTSTLNITSDPSTYTLVRIWVSLPNDNSITDFVVIRATNALEAYMGTSNQSTDRNTLPSPNLNVSTTSLNFGTVNVGTDNVLTFSVDGTSLRGGYVIGGAPTAADASCLAPFQLSETGTLSSVASNLIFATTNMDLASTTGFVHFVPTEPGTFTYTMAVTAGSLQNTITLTGTAVSTESAPELTEGFGDNEVSNVDWNADLGVFPNPANNVVKISHKGLTLGMDATVEVMNLNGQVMMSHSEWANSGSINLDVTDLPLGIYLVNVTTQDGHTMSSRIVKK